MNAKELQPLVQHTVLAAMKGQPGPCELANVAYGAAGFWKSVGVPAVGQQDEWLFKALARLAERRLDKFNAQALFNMAWAFAKVGQQDEQFFKALARTAERRLEKFNAQELANTAWAFATMGQQDEHLFKVFPESALAIIGGLY